MIFRVGQGNACLTWGLAGDQRKGHFVIFKRISIEPDTSTRDNMYVTALCKSGTESSCDSYSSKGSCVHKRGARSFHQCFIITSASII